MRSRIGGLGVAAAVAAAVCAGAPPPRAQAQGSYPGFRKRLVAFHPTPGSAVAADLDGDGRLDAAVASGEEVAWYSRGLGSSFWAKRPIFQATPESGALVSNGLVTHDLDGDGDLDLLSTTSTTGALAWYENPRDPVKPWTRRVIDALPGVHSAVLEDLNRDGRPEVVANYEGAIAYYLVPRDPRAALAANYRGEPNGRPIWERKYLARSGAGGGTHFVVFADVDGDGDRDLCTGASGSDTAPGYLAWWERPADATLLWNRRTVRADLPGATHLVPADVDRDGRLDFLVARGHAQGIAWLAGPDWKRETAIDADWITGPHTLALADIDADGDPDVASASREGTRVAWWQNDGKGAFTRRELDNAQAGNDVRAVDLDADGDLDLLVAGHTSGNVVWYENQRL